MKTFELLKELLLIESAGAYDTVHTAINLAIQIHCDQEQIDETEFKNKLKVISQAAWGNYDGKTETWQQCQKIYKQLIDMLA